MNKVTGCQKKKKRESLSQANLCKKFPGTNVEKRINKWGEWNQQ
jgi:hypothetical protein